MTITGSRRPRSANHCSRAMPSSSGRRMSLNTRAYSCFPSAVRAADTLPAVSTSKPRFESHVRSISAKVVSSSTIRIRSITSQR